MSNTHEQLLYWLLRAYESGHREGWEAGPSSSETMDRLLDVLANNDLDPGVEKDRERVETLLKRPIVMGEKSRTRIAEDALRDIISFRWVCDDFANCTHDACTASEAATEAAKEALAAMNRNPRL